MKTLFMLSTEPCLTIHDIIPWRLHKRYTDYVKADWEAETPIIWLLLEILQPLPY